MNSLKDFENLKKKMGYYLKGKPVKKAFLFGSFVRNEQDKDSDIDILLELDSTKTIGMIEFIKLSDGLESIFNKKVDLVTTDGLSPFIKPFIDNEKVLIYEA
jgi:predicted nucleotidyltransferase